MVKKLIVWVLVSIILFFVFANVDICIGVVLDEEGNGRVLNNEPYYNYISYDMENRHVNEVVLTICIMNPTNFACDDVIYRIDI